MRVLLLHIEAPLVAFGDVAIDNFGRIRDLPGQSSLTGLIANALGLDRTDRDALTALQHRLRFACRVESSGLRLTDMQTAKLGRGDRWWTTQAGKVGRDGGADTYDSPHIRWRDFDSDSKMVVACTLEPGDESPTLDEIAHFMQYPMRPLFFGRKPCLPSRPIFGCVIESPTLLDAMRSVAWCGAAHLDTPPDALLVRLPIEETVSTRLRVVLDADRRDWHAGPHTGRFEAQIGYLPLRECAEVPR